MFSLLAENGIIINDELISVGFEKNMIYSVNILSGEYRFNGFIPKESFERGRLAGSIQLWHDKLVFAPFKAKSIWISDCGFRNWEAIDLDYSVINTNRFFFWGSVLNGDELFLSGWNYSGFLKLNLLTKETQYISYGNFEPFSNCYELVSINGYIYSPVLGTNRIIVLNAQNYDISEISLDDSELKIMTMSEKDNLLWITDSGKNEIISVNLDDKSVYNCIKLPFKPLKILGMSIANDIVMAYSRFGTSFAYCISEGKSIALDNRKIYWAKGIGDSIIYYTEEGLSVLNADGNKVIPLSIEPQSDFSESIKKRIIEEKLADTDFLKENEIINLDFLIRMVNE